MSIVHFSTNTMTGAGGGGGTVNLTTGTASAVSAFFSQGGWYFNSDGTVDRFTTQSGQTQWQSSTDWIFPRTGFLNSDYQVRYQQISGSGTFTGGSDTRNVWHTLSSNRSFILEKNFTTNNLCIADIRHRTNGSLNTQVSLDDGAACMATTFMNVYLEVTGGGGGGGGCFTGGMLVLMADGSEKPIKDIMAGEEVMSYNEQTCKLEPARVNSVMTPRLCNVYEVVLNDNTVIETTAEHPFRTTEGKWANIDTEATYQGVLGGRDVKPEVDMQLQEGMKLHSMNGGTRVAKIINTGRIETVYHLSRVGTNHNYFVEGVCVHNITFEVKD